MSSAARARERRVTRRLETRGMRGLGQALVRLRGTQFGGRWELGCLFAVGAEGAVYLCHDVWDATQPMRVAKIPLLPYHKPFELSFEEVRRRRNQIRAESNHLETSASPYMPQFLGLYDFANPLLDAARGGEFAKPEPVFVMERLLGSDMDYWLARVHASTVPRAIVRRHVDHVTIVVLRALWDLHERGYFYCDLRPGNVRIRGRSEHRVRLMDAGSLVPRSDRTGGFPHVPAYLPPELFWRAEEEGPEVLVPTLAIQTVMAGRTLFEVATGRVPVPGQPVDVALLKCDTASPAIADTIEGLCTGSFIDVYQALKYLAKRTNRARSATAVSAVGAVLTAINPPREEAHVAPAAAPVPPAAASRPAVSAPARNETSAPVLVPEPDSQPVAAENAAAEPARDLASVLAVARANFKPAAVPKPPTPRQALVEAFAMASSGTPEGAAPQAAVDARSRAVQSANLTFPEGEDAGTMSAPESGNAPAPVASRPSPMRVAGIDDEILPPSKPRPSFWKRLLALFGR